MLMASNVPLPDGAFTGTYLLIANDGMDFVNGTFGSITGVPAGYIVSVDYGFKGVDSLGRTGDGNDVAITIAVPEPSTFCLIFAGGALLLWRLRQSRNTRNS